MYISFNVCVCKLCLQDTFYISTTDTEHPSICVIKLKFMEKTHYFVNFTNNYFKLEFLQNGLIDLPT